MNIPYIILKVIVHGWNVKKIMEEEDESMGDSGTAGWTIKYQKQEVSH